MSFFDDASLAFLPSGAAGKDGKAYSIKPTDGTGDFTFSRGSNLAATRVGADGLIEKGRENLLLQSNQFDTTWTKSASDLTSGQSGYDGSSDAWLLTAATPSAFSSRLNQVLSPSSSGVLTLSVYAKANTLDWILLDGLGTNGFAAWFDVRNGLKGQVTSTSIGSKITSVGNGWYRCEVYGNATTLTEVRIYVTDGDGTTTANDGDGVYIQNAQLEIGLAATDYIESGATTGKAGLLEDEPRFDYSGGATCPSLLLEPSRTQLVKYSELISQADVVARVTFQDNAAISPEGLQNATKVIPSTDDNSHLFSFGDFSADVNGHTASIYVKAIENGYNYVYITVNSSAFTPITAGGIWFDIANGTKGSATIPVADYDIEAVGTDGWYRIYATQQTNGSNTPVYLGVSATDGVRDFAGNGTDGVLVYGAQLEEGSYPTSYIPNHSGGSVTRGADSNVASGLSSVIGQTEGTIFIELDIENLTGEYRRIIGVSTSTTDNSIQLILTAVGTLEAYISQGGTYSLAYYGPTLSTGVQKLAITYKTNEAKIYRNGTLLTTDTSVVVPACSNLYLGKIPTATTSHIIGNKIKQSLLFDTAISEADAITLTTL